MRENFGLRELEAFVTIAECGSFTEAARLKPPWARNCLTAHAAGPG